MYDRSYKYIRAHRKIITVLYKKLNQNSLYIKIVRVVLNKFSVDDKFFVNMTCGQSPTKRPLKSHLILYICEKCLKVRFLCFGKMYTLENINTVSLRNFRNKHCLPIRKGICHYEKQYLICVLVIK